MHIQKCVKFIDNPRLSTWQTDGSSNLPDRYCLLISDLIWWSLCVCACLRVYVCGFQGWTQSVLRRPLLIPVYVWLWIYVWVFGPFVVVTYLTLWFKFVCSRFDTNRLWLIADQSLTLTVMTSLHGWTLHCLIFFFKICHLCISNMS